MTLSQIVAELCLQVNELEGSRKEMFLAWLHKHHRTEQPPTTETLPVFLNTWLASLPPQGIRWEAQLLLEEVAWWRTLPADRLWRMLEAKAAE